ncbi:MAG: hypothetical protein HFH86_01285 [Bacilli bacterium]|nr:hypothetical protein [Bacilli bacterium]
MLQKDDLLSILRKYGMDSKNHAPYLYEANGEIGLMYSFAHVFYGLLHRVILFQTKQDAEDFIYQYWWYKNYREQFSVTLELDHYDQLFPKPFFVMNGKSLFRNDMRNLLEDPSILPKADKQKKLYQRYLRTAKILIEILEEKVKLQKDTYQNVKELHLEFQKQENEFLQLYNRYYKTNKKLNKIDESMEEALNMEQEIQMFQNLWQDISFQTDIEELIQFIDQLWRTLYSLESESGYLQNKYLLFKLPIDLEDIRKKKDYMEKVFNKKKGLFSKKDHVEEELEKINASSETNKIVKVKDFVENERQRLDEKYAIIDDMDYVTLGDYLNEFDNMGIVTTLDMLDRVQERVYTREELLSVWQEEFLKMSKEEQQALGIYHSFLQPLCDMILNSLVSNIKTEQIIMNVQNTYAKEIEQAMITLGEAENVFLRMKYMKSLVLLNSSAFIESLIVICKQLLQMKGFSVKGTCYVFGKSCKESSLGIYHGALKSIGAPMQQKGLFDVHDIFELKAGVSLLFLPIYLKVKDPYFQDYTIEEKKDSEEVLLLLQNYHVKMEQSDIIRVVRFHGVEQKLDDCRVMIHMEEERSDSYRHIIVTK